MADDERTDWMPVDGRDGMAVRYRTDSRSGRLIVCGLRVEGDAVTADDLRRIPLARIEAKANLGDGRAVAELPPLARPDGADPDAWSRGFAEHYRAWAIRTPHPAARIAEAAGVPVVTVHRWVREARLRGHLPFAARGKAG